MSGGPEVNKWRSDALLMMGQLVSRRKARARRRRNLRDAGGSSEMRADNGWHSSDIANARRSIHLQLAMALAQQILDGAKVLLIHRDVLLELRSGVRLSSESIDRAGGKERLTYRA